jgi:pimeloyl-ACP methyl ester carboxylesterase
MAERPLWDWGLHLPADVLPIPQLTRVLPVIARAALHNLVRNPGAFIRTARVARTADLADELDALKRRRMPVVVLWGRDDRIVTEVSNDALCEALGRPERITVDGGHSWMLADPEAFAEVITNIIPIARRARNREKVRPVTAERC